MQRKLFEIGALLVIVSMLLVACGGAATPLPAEPTDEQVAEVVVEQTEEPAAEQTEEPAAEQTEEPAAEQTEEPAAEQTTEDSRYGGTLILGIENEPLNLMGLNQHRATQAVSCQLFPALLEYDFDLTPKPSLAESWEVSDDGLTYTFKLVEGAMWTDGTPMTSEDVKFSIEMNREYHPAGHANFDVIETIDTPDDTTVIFRLSAPFSPLMVLLGEMTALIIPKHVYEGTDPFANENSLTGEISGGPFKLEEWVPGDHITLVRNDNYFREGLPYLDKVIFRVMPDPNARVIALESGEIDAIVSGSMPASEIDTLMNADGIVVEGKGAEAAADVLTFGFNLRGDNPWKDVRVRQALTMATDTDYLNEVIGYGYMLPGIGPMFAGQWSYNPNLQGFPFDPEKAKQLLDEAGYPVKDDGCRFEIELMQITSWFLSQKGTELLADMFKDVGVCAILRPVENAEYVQATYIDWDFDISENTYIEGYDPDALTVGYGCENADKPVPFGNMFGYCNEEVEALLVEGRQEQDIEKSKEIYGQVQQLITTDAPAIWAFSNVEYVAYRDDLKGYPPGPWNARDPLSEVYYEK